MQLNGQVSSPYKSRLDFSAIPAANVDLRACEADIKVYKLQQVKNMLAEKKLMHEEWVKAKKARKEEVDTETFRHEEKLTLGRIEMKKMIEDCEKERKMQEKKDREEDFLAVRSENEDKHDGKKERIRIF